MTIDSMQIPRTAPHRTKKQPIGLRAQTILLSLTMLLFCLAITGIAWQSSLTIANDDKTEYFDFRVRDAISRIEQRMAAYEEVLRGVRGLYNATESVQRPAFREYVAALKLGEQYPGIQGVGFSLLIPPSKREKHVQSIRDEGFPSYAIRPDTPRDTYTSIIYLEPFSDRNLRAFGYDMYSEAVRRTAMEQARDSDRIVISGKVRLVQETNEKPQAGFLMYLPIYHIGDSAMTTQQRRAAIIGWAYSPFRMNDLMDGIQGEQASDLDIEIFDGPLLIDSTRMYDSDDIRSEKKSNGTVLQKITALNIAGHLWTVQVNARPEFYNRVNSRYPDILLLAGFMISLLITVVTWMLLTGRERAVAMAEKMTVSLKASEIRLRNISLEMNLILETAPVGISKTVDRKQVWVNHKTETMFGYSRDELVDKTTEFLYPSNEFYEKMGEQAYPVLTKGIEYETVQELIQKNGNHIWVKYNGRAIDPADMSQGTIWVLADITEQKRTAEMLCEKELLYHAMFERNSAVKLLINPESGVIVDANTAAAKFYGYSVEELKSMTINKINTLPAENIREEIDNETFEDRSFFNFQHRLANGSIRHVEVFSSPLNIHGKTLLHSIIHDVTDRRNAELQVKKSLEEKEVLLREIHHRVKNNMAVITSLLRLQGERITDKATRQLFTESEQRIKSMAMIHERLYQADDLGVVDIQDYFNTIMRDLVASYHSDDRTITTKITGDDLKFDIDTAIPCGLIVNELITNVLKYAFPRQEAGSITVAIDKQDDRYTLTVQDDGIGFPAGFDHHTTGTLGLQLVEALCTQLRATLLITTDPATGRGATISITFKNKSDRQPS